MKFSNLILALVVVSAVGVPQAIAQTGAGVNLNIGAGVNPMTGATTSAGATITIGSSTGTTSEERTGLLENAAGVEIRTSADVMTEDDLDAFEENLLVADMRIADADSSNSRVAISYWHDGRFLAVWPVRLQSRTEIRISEEQTLNISTSMPWWSFLVAGLGNVKGNVEASLTADGQFAADVLAVEDAKARARALEAIASAHATVRAEKE